MTASFEPPPGASILVVFPPGDKPADGGASRAFAALDIAGRRLAAEPAYVPRLFVTDATPPAPAGGRLPPSLDPLPSLAELLDPQELAEFRAEIRRELAAARPDAAAPKASADPLDADRAKRGGE